MAGRRRGRNSGETRVREGAGEHVEGNVEGGDGGDVHLILPPTGLDRLAGVGWGGGHKFSKVQEPDYNRDGWRSHLAALLWDIMFVRCPLPSGFYCL